MARRGFAFPGARKECRALGTAHPLVQIGTVEIRADLLQIQRNLTDCMCAIDNADYACLTCATTNLLDRKDERGW